MLLTNNQMGNKPNKQERKEEPHSKEDLPLRLQLFNEIKSLSSDDIHSYLLKYTAFDSTEAGLQTIHSLIKNVHTNATNSMVSPAMIPTFIILKSALNSHNYLGNLSQNISLIIIDYLTFVGFDSLIGYWRLNNFEEGLKDLSNSQNNIPLSKPEWNTIYDSQSECIHLSEGAFIDIPNTNDALDINAMTIERFVANAYNGITIAMYVSKQGGCDGPLFCYRGRRAWNVHVWMYSNSFMSRICGVDRSQFPTCAQTNFEIELDRFYFVTVTYDRVKGENKIYIDGNLEANVYIGQIDRIGTAGNIAVGNIYNRFLNAKIKGIQVYNKALNQNEISEIMEYDALV